MSNQKLNQKIPNKLGKSYDTRNGGNNNKNYANMNSGISSGNGKKGRQSRNGEMKNFEKGDEGKSSDAGFQGVEEWPELSAQCNGTVHVECSGENKEEESYNGEGDKSYAKIVDSGETIAMGKVSSISNVANMNKVVDTVGVDKVDANKTGNRLNFAQIVKNNHVVVEKKLTFVKPEVNNEGKEVVIFDEDMVKEGCKKWSNTICGHFVGFNMKYGELKYNIMRMWRKFGLMEVITNGNGIFFFKFSNDDNLDYLIENGPWMINNKPLIIQRWNPDIVIDRSEPKKLPLWIKLRNIPLEAWNNVGISKLASRIGRPIMMDNMTAKMCSNGMGRAEFARVLVEIEAKKGFTEEIEIHYKDENSMVKNVKFVSVEYAWKPMTCKHCEVFGHGDYGCKVMATEKVGEKNEEEKNGGQAENGQMKVDGFQEVQYKRRQNNYWPQKNKYQYQKKNFMNSSSDSNNRFAKLQDLGKEKGRGNGEGINDNKIQEGNGIVFDKNEPSNGKDKNQDVDESKNKMGDNTGNENEWDKYGFEEVEEDSSPMAKFISTNEYGSSSSNVDVQNVDAHGGPNI